MILILTRSTLVLNVSRADRRALAILMLIRRQMLSRMRTTLICESRLLLRYIASAHVRVPAGRFGGDLFVPLVGCC